VTGSERVRIREVRAAPLLLVGLAPQLPADLSVGANSMTLWDLLTAVCFAMPIGSALASSKHAKVGLGGYALATAVGLGLGVCCAWTMQTVGKTVAARIKRHSESLQGRYFRALYFAAMLWIVFALFLGAWVSSAVMMVVF
jgi:hypothetical protein